MKIRHITQYLFESFKDAQAKFSQEASEDEVQQYLDTFKQLAKKGVVSGQEKDIGYWIKQGWAEFKYFVDRKSQEKSKSQVKKSKKSESIVVHDDKKRFAVIPLTKDASCYYGKNTKWCTSGKKDNKFDEYFYMDDIVLIYVYMKTTGKKYSGVYSMKKDKFEYYDEEDKSMTEMEFKDVTGFDKFDIKDWVSEYKQTIEHSMDINKAPEDIQIKLIETDPHNIKYIHEPSIDFQLRAVSKDGHSIQHINNPKGMVQIAAINSKASSFDYIENPSEKVTEIYNQMKSQ